MYPDLKVHIVLTLKTLALGRLRATRCGEIFQVHVARSGTPEGFPPKKVINRTSRFFSLCSTGRRSVQILLLNQSKPDSPQ